MASYENDRKAADKITNILNQGFRLTQPELHFIESSFSVSSANDLRELINADESDLDVICELVVSPDHLIREDLELFFCDASFCNEDEEKLITSFGIKNLETKITFPATGESVSVHLTDYLAQRFITKLNITQNPDKRLFEATATLPEPLRLKALVRLRNARMIMTQNTISFLIELIRVITRGDDFFSVFDFAISAMEEESQPTEVMEMFIRKKRFHEKTLGTIRTVKKQLETSAVETLMMLGTRVPPASEEDVESKIDIAAAILASVFGYIDLPDHAPSEINLGRIADKNDITKVFRILS